MAGRYAHPLHNEAPAGNLSLRFTAGALSCSYYKAFLNCAFQLGRLMIIRITAAGISTIPTANRSVKGSPKHKQLTTTAVTGSKAPSMAVGVLPMLLIATLIKNNDNTVGNNANCKAHNHCVPLCRTCKGSLATII